jgi:hypothetical protein
VPIDIREVGKVQRYDSMLSLNQALYRMDRRSSRRDISGGPVGFASTRHAVHGSRHRNLFVNLIKIVPMFAMVLTVRYADELEQSARKSPLLSSILARWTLLGILNHTPRRNYRVPK